jgi:hypothetical protein
MCVGMLAIMTGFCIYALSGVLTPRRLIAEMCIMTMFFIGHLSFASCCMMYSLSTILLIVGLFRFLRRVFKFIVSLFYH